MRKEERCLDVAPPPTLDSESIDGLSPLLAEICELTKASIKKSEEKEAASKEKENHYYYCSICYGTDPNCPRRGW